MLGTLAAFLCGAATFAHAARQDDTTEDRQLAKSAELFVGWKTTHLDLNVHLQPEKPTLIVDGEMELTLQADEAEGVTLALNLARTCMEWVEARVDDKPADVNLEIELYPTARLAEVRFDEPKHRGDKVHVTFRAEWKKNGSQLGISNDIAIASWTMAWYPFPIPRIKEGEEFAPALISAPGTTTFRMPKGWTALCDGLLVNKIITDDEVIEVRELGDAHVARSFSAAPYYAGQVEGEGRQASAYLLKERDMSVEDMAAVFEQIIEAQEEAFGPYPFTTVGVAEVPERIPGWYAASQQTFIMAKSSAFEHGHINLPLWAHELCHAWWGNTVMTIGDAEKVVSESLAQFGCVLAIEKIEGVEARNTFLDFSRSGYSPLQCARGYFHLVRQGKDHPLSDLSNSELSGDDTHSLADSKGMWVYHMLRIKLGDELTFKTFQQIFADHQDRPLSLADLRETFIAAAPEHDLEMFFAQWFDRTGAPRLETKVTGEPGAQVVTVTQTQEGEPYVFDLDLALTLADGSIVNKTVPLTQVTGELKLDVQQAVESIELDPEHKLLIFREDYAKPREGDAQADH